VFVYGDPMLVPADADRDVMESRRRELEATLEDLTARAETLAAR
jgi:hypothetical protein